jgi:hypothetical protein
MSPLSHASTIMSSEILISSGRVALGVLLELLDEELEGVVVVVVVVVMVVEMVHCCNGSASSSGSGEICGPELSQHVIEVIGGLSSRRFVHRSLALLVVLLSHLCVEGKAMRKSTKVEACDCEKWGGRIR